MSDSGMDGTDINGMSAQDLLTGLASSGIEQFSNGVMAGRLPPDDSVGIHPDGYFKTLKNGDLFKRLSAELPAPMPRPSPDFKNAAGDDKAPENASTLTYNPPKPL